jgi:hypothetical protein
MYEKLGLKKEDVQGGKAREEADSSGSLRSDVPPDLDYGDVLPVEIVSLCDWKNPIMKFGCRYKDMATFQLTMRQFAIKNEFDLGI